MILAMWRSAFCKTVAFIRAKKLATATGHRTLSMLLRYSNLDAKSSKKFSDHIATKILKGQNHE
jgi:hypothetical protein